MTRAFLPTGMTTKGVCHGYHRKLRTADAALPYVSTVAITPRTPNGTTPLGTAHRIATGCDSAAAPEASGPGVGPRAAVPPGCGSFLHDCPYPPDPAPPTFAGNYDTK